MLEVKMTIEIPGLPEALNALAGAIGKQPEFVCHQHGGNNHHIDNAGVVNVDFPAAPAPAAPVVNPTTPVQPAPTTGTVAPTPVQPTAPMTAAPTVPVVVPASVVPTSAPQYTLDMIATAGSALIDAGKMDQLMGLLGKFGVASLTELAPESYGAVANELRALGAAI